MSPIQRPLALLTLVLAVFATFAIWGMASAVALAQGPGLNVPRAVIAGLLGDEVRTVQITLTPVSKEMNQLDLALVKSGLAVTTPGANECGFETYSLTAKGRNTARSLGWKKTGRTFLVDVGHLRLDSMVSQRVDGPQHMVTVAYRLQPNDNVGKLTRLAPASLWRLTYQVPEPLSLADLEHERTATMTVTYSVDRWFIVPKHQPPIQPNQCKK